ncbi:MAG TPA: FecR domain-containing protein [Gemmatimonadaceae bacterium]|nr:FecR domain-containing protein [Gemmatimonadaceae bacterium]
MPSTEFLLTDEAALRKVYDDEYPGLIAKAKTELGEAVTLAPRVVEQAFVHLWAEREAITSPEQLRAVLHEDLHRSVVRALSRRAAAHRMGDRHGAHGNGHQAHEAHEDKDASWQRVLTGIHGTHDPASQAAAAAAAKHEAAAHVKQIAKRGSWKMPVLIGALALAGAFAAVWFLDKAGIEQAGERAVNAQDARPLSSGIAQRANVTLDDSTKALLAADSKLAVANGFNDELRAVKLDGAASFVVPATGENDLQVFARKAMIASRGASFLVRAYESDEAALIQVRAGTVSLRIGDAKQSLAAGQSLVVADDGTTRQPTAAELTQASSWIDGKLVVEGQPLRVALHELRRWFDADVKVIEPELFERPVTIRADLGATRDAIAQVEQTGGLRFERTQEMMIFKDTADVAQAGAPKAGAGQPRARGGR